ncbi:MAG: hypothetical protein LC105_07010, partial [Chitinophagales bacterium]|nr:hypothetical protein [Chitinophagales bacterium]
KDNPKADWYIWKDGRGKNGLKRPNNWRAMSGNRAWTYHQGRKQFYYNGFLPFQPDLNYHQPDVKNAMFDVVRFWLEKGVDGFRLDIISAIYEDSSLKNNPLSIHMTPSDRTLSIFFQHLGHNFLQEESFGFSTELREVVDEFEQPQRILIGESHGHESVLREFCNYKGKNGLHAIFMFNAISMPFKARKYQKMTETFEKYFAEPLMPTLVFANHDRNRTISRLGGSADKAKLLAMFQFTSRGIPFTYFGEEIGIPRVIIPLKEGKDPIAQQNKWLPQFLVNRSVEILNRDECRTPMLWNTQANAGFCDSLVKPWLPVADNYQQINVETQKSDPQSQYNFFKKIISLRNHTPALQSGSLEIAQEFCSKKVFAYYRTLGKNRYLVVLNMSKKSLDQFEIQGDMIVSTHVNSTIGAFFPYEGKVFLVHR